MVQRAIFMMGIVALLLLMSCKTLRDSYGVARFDSDAIGAASALQKSISYSCGGTGSSSSSSSTSTSSLGTASSTYCSPPGLVKPPVTDQSSAAQPATSALVWEGCFQAPLDDQDSERCRLQRNSVTWVLLSASNDMCQDHLKGIFRNEASSNLATGTLTSLFSGAAAVTTPGSASRVLAALGSFSSGERSLLNEVVYKERLISAITSKINQTRTVMGREIAGKQLKGINEYGLNAALYDVLQYHYSCSFMFGLEKTLEEGQQNSQEVLKAKLEKERAELVTYLDNRSRILGIKPTDTRDLQQDLAGAGAINRIKAIDAKLLSFISEPSVAQSSASHSSASNSSQGNPP